ncbi:SusD/RagB family nutrient-binding outer membrane lipoprotein [Flaviaesturariibacter amylovorans]|uniref:SusD/RagB family nutrient-binding outer membrane lipoprotein n=1 Tax=Flaviaesturariibacter amylovorans TaxID=1084520 RepID=A0ABP8G957_9BACT
MKLKRIIYATSLAALMLGMGSCKKDKFDINANPDDVTDVSVTPQVLLPAAQVVTSDIVATNFTTLQMWMGFWARSGSYQSLTEIETYKFGRDFESQIWTNLYANANNYQIMINKSKADGAAFYEGVGRIMKAHNFGILVDIYNNVPYFEAFRGTAEPTPAYDKGVDIYNDLFKQLDTAITLLKSPAAADASLNPEKSTSDLVYAGDPTAWVRFANTLRLRLLIHLHNGINSTQVAPGVDVAAQVAKFTTEGFIGAGQSAHLNPGFSGAKPQPFYRRYNTNEAGTGSQRDHVRANDYAIRYYTYNADPRLARFYVAGASGQKGIKFGQASGDQTLIGSNLSTVRAPGYSPNGASSRAWILTSVESLFLQAEAIQRGIAIPGAGTPADALRAAVRESFVWLGLTSAQADTYISTNAGYEDVDITAPGGGLFTILSQKWFALNGIAPYELYTDYRRTDYVLGDTPNIGFTAGPPLSIDPNRASRIPRRLFYPQNEYNYNTENVTAQGDINVTTGRIFWDLN